MSLVLVGEAAAAYCWLVFRCQKQKASRQMYSPAATKSHGNRTYRYVDERQPGGRSVGRFVTVIWHKAYTEGIVRGLVSYILVHTEHAQTDFDAERRTLGCGGVGAIGAQR